MFQAHLITGALLPAEPAREMDGDVGGNLNPAGQDFMIRLYTCSCPEAGNPR
jgi:hypothetical protein